MKHLWVALGLMLTGCQATTSTPPHQLMSWKGEIVNQPVCDNGQCKAVIKRSEGYWSYDDVYAGSDTAAVTKGQSVWKTCAYYRTHERCSTFWTTRPDEFYPPATAE